MTDIIPLKRCKNCLQEFPSTRKFFRTDKRNPDGLRNQCITCKKNGTKMVRLSTYPGDVEIPEGTPTRRCTRCEKTFPATTKFFYAANGPKSSSTGLCTHCKWCRLDPDKRPPMPEKDTAHKRCARCKEKFPATEEAFGYRKSRGKDGWNKPQLRSKCRACQNAVRKEYFHNNKEEKRDEWNAQLNEYRQKNIEHCRALYRDWRMANIEREIARGTKRRAFKMQSDGQYTGEDVKVQYKRQKGKCYWCTQPFKKTSKRVVYHVDHYIPLSRGGSNSADNIVLACPFCNISRKDRLPHEWRRGGRLF